MKSTLKNPFHPFRFAAYLTSGQSKRPMALLRLLGVIGVSGAWILNAPEVNAQTNGTWLGGGPGGSWTTTGNWASGTVPGDPTNPNAGTATFNISTPSNAVISLSAARNIGALRFDTASVGAFTISGSTLLFYPSNGAGAPAASIEMTSSVTTAQTINSTIEFRRNSSTNSGGNQTIINNATSSAATLTLGGIVRVVTADSAATDRTLILGGSNTGANTISGVIQEGAGAYLAALQKTGAGTWVLTGANTYSSTTTLSGGILSVSNLGNGGVASSIGDSSNAAGNLVFDGGTLRYTGANTTSDRAFTIVAGKTATIETANNLSFAGATGVATTGALTKTGAGVLTLTGNNTYTGLTTISVGTLQIGNGGTFGAIAGNITNNAALVFNRSDTYTYNGNVSGNGSLTHSGTGALILTGNNSTMTGSVVNNSNQVFILGANAGSVSAAFNLAASGGTFYTGLGNTVNMGSLSGVGGTTLRAGGGGIGTATFSIGALGTSTEFAGSIVNSNTDLLTAITKVGAGTWTLSGNATHTGGTTISGGTLRIGNGGTTGSIAGNITNNAALAFNRSDALTYGGVVSGSGSLTKLGAGALTFSAANTYTGSTLVSGGTLLISGTGSVNNTSAVTVNTGGTFRYDSSVGLNRNVTLNGGRFANNSVSNYTGTLTFTSGTLGGSNFSGNALTIGTNQTLAPGNSTGTLSAGATTWTNGGTLQFEINDATGTAGSTTAGWDLFTPTTLDITAGVGQFTIQIVSLDNLQSSGLAQNFIETQNYQWTIVDAGSAITGFDPNQFTFNSTGFQNAFSGQFSISQGTGLDTDKLFLNYAASVIPEPSTTLLLTGGLMAIVLLRRRRF